MQLLEWHNLIFVAPIALAAIYLILSATGLSGADTDADADVHVDHDVTMDHDVDLDHDVSMDHDLDHDLSMDHDVDLDHDVSMDHDVDLDHDVSIDHDVDLDHDVDIDHGMEHGLDADHDHHVGGGHNDSLMLRALSVIGFGKVPMSILFLCLAVLFGATGLVANGLFEHVLPWAWGPALYVWPSLALAVLVSLTLTGTIARGMGRIMPTTETYAIRPGDLVGCVGTAVYPLTAGRPGVVHCHDAGGTVQQIAAVSRDTDLPKGTEVIIVRYRAEEGHYDVSASPL